jgi:hypothetical protein
MASCVVRFVETEGIGHIAEVEKRRPYEAAALAMRSSKPHDCEPGLITKLEVEIRRVIIHAVTPKRIHHWLLGGSKRAKEAGMKECLRLSRLIELWLFFLIIVSGGQTV